MDVQLMRPVGSIRSCVIFEEARLVSSRHTYFSFDCIYSHGVAGNAIFTELIPLVEYSFKEKNS